MALPAVLAALTVAGEVVDSVTQFRNARAQARFQQKRARQNKRAALESLGEQSFDIRLQTDQQRAQIAQELEGLVASALDVKGKIASSAAAAGVAGTSVQDIQLEAAATEQRTAGQLRLFQEFRNLAADRAIRQLTIRTRNRVLAGQPGPTTEPSVLGATLSVAGAGFSGFAAGLQLEDAFTDPVDRTEP